MSDKGRNDGFRVLDDFVCEAIHSPGVPLANEQHQGHNAGSLVVEELSFDASAEKPGSEEVQDPDSRKVPGPVALDDAIRSEAGRVAALISASRDPNGTLALFQKALLTELDSMQKSAPKHLNRAAPRTDPDPS